MRYAFAMLAGASALLAGCAARASVAVEPEVAIVQSHAEEADHVWVCHRGRWLHVAAPAANAHRHHGDRVSRAAHRARAAC